MLRTADYLQSRDKGAALVASQASQNFYFRTQHTWFGGLQHLTPSLGQPHGVFARVLFAPSSLQQPFLSKRRTTSLSVV